ncbi:hypothetical protein ET33_06010 [Paenibacillus tyrfis]|uniref:Transposase IS116/IS110/IS902 C-terminal domain-containing protein n=1 Tax=Paenibacillus tyrfis TaxID=1501230 RepID=A0A081P2J2_9BACL|nr:hypothetical protein ET33_06010 [Paenibacillus tyrfis]
MELVTKDGETKRNYQLSRDFLTVVQDMKRSRELIKDSGAASGDGFQVAVHGWHCTVTAAELIAKIGDIRRFSNVDKLARFAGIAPVRFSLGGKGKDKASGKGNRVLNAIFHNLAVQQVQVAKGDNKNSGIPSSTSITRGN